MPVAMTSLETHLPDEAMLDGAIPRSAKSELSKSWNQGSSLIVASFCKPKELKKRRQEQIDDRFEISKDSPFISSYIQK